MKISGKNPPPGVGIAAYKKEADEVVAQKKKETSANKNALLNQDAVSLSISSNSSLSKTEAIESSAPADRSEKLAKLKNQILSGGYELSSTRIAQSFVQYFGA